MVYLKELMILMYVILTDMIIHLHCIAKIKRVKRLSWKCRMQILQN